MVKTVYFIDFHFRDKPNEEYGIRIDDRESYANLMLLLSELTNNIRIDDFGTMTGDFN